MSYQGSDAGAAAGWMVIAIVGAVVGAITTWVLKRVLR